MDRLIAILLIPLFVVGNSFAHSHGTAAHQSPIPSRAHFHVNSDPHHGHDKHESHEHSHHHHHGHDHHGHHHDEHDQESDESKSSPLAPADHDSDAVYVVAADFLYTTCYRIAIEIDSHAFIGTVVCLLTDFSPTVRRDRPPLATTADIPLYLLHAALRL